VYKNTINHQVAVIISVADIFKTARPLGNFAALLMTYIASSVLHVCNTFRLAFLYPVQSLVAPVVSWKSTAVIFSCSVCVTLHSVAVLEFGCHST